MRRQLLPAVRMLLVLTVLLGLAYPLAMTGIAQGLFKNKADGSVIKVDGKAVGSKLIGQQWLLPKAKPTDPDRADPRYFQSRPSAAGDDPTASGASNLGPSDQGLLDMVKQRVIDYRTLNGLAASTPVPADAITASGSGLDPDISLQNADLQAARIARVRGLSVAEVQKLIRQHEDKASLGFLGEPGVNVLELNLALDKGVRS